MTSENPTTESSTTTVKHFELTPLPPLSTTPKQFLPTTNFAPTVATEEEISVTEATKLETPSGENIEPETVTPASAEPETATTSVTEQDIATTVQQPDTTQVEIVTTTATTPSTTKGFVIKKI